MCEMHEIAMAHRCLPENEPLLSQIDELKNLRQDWNGYGADPIDAKIIEAAKEFVRSLDFPVLNRPQVVPMTRGRLQLEWHSDDRSVELEFESPVRVHYLKWSPKESVEEEDVVPLSQRGRILELIRWFESGVTDG